MPVSFVQVRDLQNSFFNQLTAVAMTVFEKYNQENSDVESLPEDARTLLQVCVCVFACLAVLWGNNAAAACMLAIV